MSIHQVIATLRGALADPMTGLAVRAEALANDASIVGLSLDLNFERWFLSGNMQQATRANVSVSPRGWDALLKQQAGEIRDARVQLQIGYEVFQSDPQVIEDHVSTYAAALMQVLDRLREYSDANNGTVVLVEEPVSFQFGPFTGASQSGGFIASAVIRERGSE